MAYPCQWPGCGKTLASKTTLKTHVASIHNGQKWPCSVAGCNAEFRDAANRNRHLRLVHNVVVRRLKPTPPPAVCPFCGFRASRADNMRRHERNCKKGPPTANNSPAADPVGTAVAAPVAAAPVDTASTSGEDDDILGVVGAGPASDYNAFSFNTPVNRDMKLARPIDNVDATIDPSLLLPILAFNEMDTEIDTPSLFPEAPLGQQDPPFQLVPGMNGYAAFTGGAMPPNVPNTADQGAAADGPFPPQAGGPGSFEEELLDFSKFLASNKPWVA